MRSVETIDLKCDFRDAILPYLYGESSSADRDRFESHLVDCSACTDEFAELSFARYSVFEWQKEEFASMPTPQIVIPYKQKTDRDLGFFAGLRELLVLNWATTAGAVAVLAVVAGLGFLAVNYDRDPGAQLAGIDETNKNISTVKTVPSPVAPVTGRDVEVVTTEPRSDPQRSVVPIKATTVNRRPKQPTAPNSIAPRQLNTEAVRVPQQDRRTPSLTGGADDDDRSLRLTDLFDAVDTRL